MNPGGPWLDLSLLILLGIPFAIAADGLAWKIGGTRWLWVVVCLIPGINMLVFPILLAYAYGAVLDGLARIDRSLTARHGMSGATGQGSRR